MTRFVGTPLRGIEFATVSDEAVSVRVSGDEYARLRIDAGGRLVWSSGASAGDTNLFRTSANLLKTDDALQAALGLITLTTSGVPVAALPDGAMAVDSTNDKFYFRSNSTWQEVSSGGSISTDLDGGSELNDILEAEISNLVFFGFDGEGL